METSFERAEKAVKGMEEALFEYLATREDIERLETYLNSDDRRKDIEADERGGLPKELKRGVLSEDGIWNLLKRADELNAQIADNLS